MKSDELENLFELVVFSFGFKHGAPEDVTMMVDVRFLPNPYWEEDMRYLTGLEKSVSDYVLKSESGCEFLEKFEPMLEFMVARNIEVGKTEMRIGIGCTGGQHRSVAVVEQLGNILGEYAVNLMVFHRDLDKKQVK